MQQNSDVVAPKLRQLSTLASNTTLQRHCARTVYRQLNNLLRLLHTSQTHSLQAIYHHIFTTQLKPS